jgi:hypothetical protein
VTSTDSSARVPAPNATIIDGVAHNGRPCRIVDNTGTVPPADLQSLLDELIEQRRFGLSGMSVAGSNAIRLGAPEFTHLQLGDEIYRFILMPYEAWLDAF